MKKFSFTYHFKWKVLLLRILVNALAILLTALLVPKIYFGPVTIWNILIIAISLGILNAVIKPLLMFLTAQLFFATFGIFIILINTLILYLISYFFPTIFFVDGLLWALVGGALLGLFSNSLDNLLGLTPPIVPDEQRELRQRISEESAPTLQHWMKQPKPVTSQAETQTFEELQSAQAALEVITASNQPPTQTLETSTENAPPPEPTPPSPTDASGGEA